MSQQFRKIHIDTLLAMGQTFTLEVSLGKLLLLLSLLTLSVTTEAAVKTKLVEYRCHANGRLSDTICNLLIFVTLKFSLVCDYNVFDKV